MFEPLTEDALTWIIYADRKTQASSLFFKLKHNLSIERNWFYFFAPDVDLLEVKPDKTLIAYEIKGQRKRKGEYDWPAIYDGLGQALAYLLLPFVGESGGKRLFGGGAFDYVWLVNARPDTRPQEDELKLLHASPLGYLAIAPDGTMNEAVPPKPNPLQSKEAKEHLLQHLSTLKEFSENSRTFHNLRMKFSPPS